jgi:hypothetical protein
MFNIDNNQNQICAICGERLATTRDHVPPAGIFPKPRPSDLITIPCCFECNNSNSRWDEIFRVLMSLHVSRNDPEWQTILNKNVIPTLKHNLKLQQNIFENFKSVLLITPSGILLEKGFELNWNSEAYERVIERTIRGLHFHHTGEILGSRAKVHVKFLNNINKIAKTFEQFPLRSIGNGQVLYKTILHPDIPLQSVWIFEFRGWMWSGGYVEPN